MFREDLKRTVDSYCTTIPDLSVDNRTPSDLLIDFCVEAFKQHRNYPASYSEEMIEKDLCEHISTIAMAVVDMYSKEGAENLTSVSENGTKSVFENAFISNSLFKNVSPFVRIL